MENWIPPSMMKSYLEGRAAPPPSVATPDVVPVPQPEDKKEVPQVTVKTVGTDNEKVDNANSA